MLGQLSPVSALRVSDLAMHAHNSIVEGRLDDGSTALGSSPADAFAYHDVHTRLLSSAPDNS